MSVSFDNNLISYPKNPKSGFLEKKYNHFSKPKSDIAFEGGLTQVATDIATETITSKSFTKYLNIAADKLAGSNFVKSLVQNRKFNKFIKGSLENPGLYEALIAVVVTCTLRPLAIMFTPGSKVEDKQYAAAQSISSGLSGLGFAYAVYKPIEAALDNIKYGVNHSNIKKAFKSFYENPENKTLIDELIQNNIIPNREQFEKLSISSKNLLKSMSSYIKENGQLKKIEKIMTGDNKVEKTAWKNLAHRYGKTLQETFDKVKFNDILPKNKYMVYDFIKFREEGKYAAKLSQAAAKTNFLLNFSSKFIFAPLLALLTIATLSKLVKYLFKRNKKSPDKNTPLTDDKNFIFAQNLKNDNKSNAIFKAFINNNNQVKASDKISFGGRINKQNNIQSQNISFSGGNPLGKAIAKTYDKVYAKPVSDFFTAIYQAITSSKIFSNWINKQMVPETVTKYGKEILRRDSDHKILSKFDSNVYLKNFPQIVSLWLSSFYIINTLANKNIEKERKPNLCTQMGIVALFSFAASKGLERLFDPFKRALIRIHEQLMKEKVTYDIAEGWKKAYQLSVITFAFRFLGPVVATPIATKLIHFLEKNKILNINKLFGVETNKNNKVK